MPGLRHICRTENERGETDYGPLSHELWHRDECYHFAGAHDLFLKFGSLLHDFLRGFVYSVLRSFVWIAHCLFHYSSFQLELRDVSDAADILELRFAARWVVDDGTEKHIGKVE